MNVRKCSCVLLIAAMIFTFMPVMSFADNGASSQETIVEWYLDISSADSSYSGFHYGLHGPAFKLGDTISADIENYSTGPVNFTYKWYGVNEWNDWEPVLGSVISEEATVTINNPGDYACVVADNFGNQDTVYCTFCTEIVEVSDDPASDLNQTCSYDILFMGDEGYAVISDAQTTGNRLDVPSEVDYEGKSYPIVSLSLGDNNESIEILSLPETIMYVDFWYFDGLRAIYVARSNPYFEDGDRGVLYNKGKTELVKYPPKKEGASFVVPSSVEVVGDNAFEGNDYLESIDFSNVSEIGFAAANACGNLESVKLGNSLKILRNSAFCGTAITNITIPQSVTEMEIYCVGYYWDGESNREEVDPDCVIDCITGSTAYNYAIANGIKWKDSVAEARAAQEAARQEAARQAALAAAAAAQPAEIQDLPAVKISKPKAAKKAVTVKWKKVNKKNLKKIGGIEIQVATDSDFTNIVKTATVGKKKTSKKIKGLTSKQTYWVRIRAYNNAADGKHVSAWKVKKFKAK